MIKRIIVMILALGLVSWGVVSCTTSDNANNGQISPNDATSTSVAATANADVANTIATVNAIETQQAITPTPLPPVTVDLLTAVNQKLVTASFTSSGGASGDVIEITLHRLNAPVNSDIQVTLPPGLLLTNSDPTEQNMVLLQIEGMEGSLGAGTYTPATVMELAPGDTDAYYVVQAYCVNLHKGNPSSGKGMTLSGQASSDLVSLMKAEQSRNDSDSVIQAAVWAITDNPTRDDLNQVGPDYQLSDQDLQSVRDLLRAAGLNPANYQLTA